MSVCRCITSQPLAVSGGGPCGKKAYDVRHVATAHEQATGVDRVANQLRHPPDRLQLDFGCGRRQSPCAEVGVHSRGKHFTKDAYWCRRRGDVTEESRMSVESRMSK